MNKNIPILINFGNLTYCLDSFIPDNTTDCPNWKIADIATFTITEKKLRQSPNYIEEESIIAARSKQCNPEMQIVPLVAVYEYPVKNTSLPSAEWVKNTGIQTLEYDHLDGLIYFRWSPSKALMGDTIEDVVHKPEYINAFSEVFEQARNKYHK